MGAYNLIFRTADGGKNWEPWFDRTRNPKLFNLYAIRPAAGGLYLAGEGGLVLRLDAGASRFVAQPVDYKGSFFGVTGDNGYVLVFGLRGNAFRSDDAGRTWAKVGLGLLGVDCQRDDHRARARCCWPISGAAWSRSATAAGASRRCRSRIAMPLAGIASAGNGKLALAGPRGVAVAELRAADGAPPGYRTTIMALASDDLDRMPVVRRARGLRPAIPAPGSSGRSSTTGWR